MPKKIAFISHYTDLYGANRSLLNLIDGVVGHGVVPLVFCPREGELSATLREKGVETKILPYNNWVGGKWTRSRALKGIGRMIDSLQSARSLSRECMQCECDLIYTNSSVTGVGALAAMYSGLPHVWHLREFTTQDYERTFDLGDFLTRRIIAQSRIVVCVSEAVRRHYFGEAPRKNVHVVYNGVSWERDFDQRVRIKDSDTKLNEVVFALVGIFNPNKGNDIAIKAIGLLRSKGIRAKLLLAGYGDEKFMARCRSLCVQLNVADQVEFLGYVPDPFQVYQRVDAVLMCSRHEAMGRVTVESMSAMRPIIASAGGASHELVRDGVDGFLYHGDEHSLAACMEKLINLPDRGLAMGQAGWHKAREKFSVEAYSNQVLTLLKKI